MAVQEIVIAEAADGTKLTLEIDPAEEIRKFMGWSK